jgi:tetraacyldisaccharide 4'-kinase
MYGAATTFRRHCYTTGSARRRVLTRPVVSIGNLRVGGSGKTPIAEYVARLLLNEGHRPAILTRGYARRIADPGVTVVSDGISVMAALDRAGDEPLMLARSLPGVGIFVGADRYLCGCLAERRFGADVHVLDDGFQHLQLARDVDLLLVSEEDLTDRPLPAGRLREPLRSARAASAVLVTAGYDSAAERVGRALAVDTVFRVTRTIGAPREIVGRRESVVVPAGAPVFLVTGIARPDRFVADVVAAGWEVAGLLTFRDHHRFDARDVRRIAAAARTAAAAIVLTTEKDAVRLAACDLGDMPIASVPLRVGVEPAEKFRAWLLAGLSSGARPDASIGAPGRSAIAAPAEAGVAPPMLNLQAEPPAPPALPAPPSFTGAGPRRHPNAAAALGTPPCARTDADTEPRSPMSSAWWGRRRSLSGQPASSREPS